MRVLSRAGKLVLIATAIAAFVAIYLYLVHERPAASLAERNKAIVAHLENDFPKGTDRSTILSWVRGEGLTYDATIVDGDYIGHDRVIDLAKIDPVITARIDRVSLHAIEHLVTTDKDRVYLFFDDKNQLLGTYVARSQMGL